MNECCFLTCDGFCWSWNVLFPCSQNYNQLICLDLCLCLTGKRLVIMDSASLVLSLFIYSKGGRKMGSEGQCELLLALWKKEWPLPLWLGCGHDSSIAVPGNLQINCVQLYKLALCILCNMSVWYSSASPEARVPKDFNSFLKSS
jgi:hypothetical protein